MIVCCVFEGFLEIIVRHADHGDTLLNGYPGTRVPGPKNPAGFGSDPDPVVGSTRPGKPAGYPGSKRTGHPYIQHSYMVALGNTWLLSACLRCRTLVDTNVLLYQVPGMYFGPLLCRADCRLYCCACGYVDTRCSVAVGAWFVPSVAFAEEAGSKTRQKKKYI